MLLEYVLIFLGGLVSFLSPCMLPVLPVYVSYLSREGRGRWKTLLSAVWFVLGFTAVFCCFGLFAGSVGALLHRFHRAIDVASGVLVLLLGLEFLGILHLPFLSSFHSEHGAHREGSAFVFGVMFSLGHAPCMSAFLGTALVTASTFASAWKGVVLLLCYSLGLALPFLAAAGLVEKFSETLAKISRHKVAISRVCGILLILFGIALASGLLHKFTHV